MMTMMMSDDWDLMVAMVAVAMVTTHMPGAQVRRSAGPSDERTGAGRASERGTKNPREAIVAGQGDRERGRLALLEPNLNLEATVRST